MDLNEKRADLLAQAKQVVERAKNEKRDLTKSEVDQTDSLFAQIDDVDVQLGKARKSQDLVARLNRHSTGEPVDPVGTPMTHGSKAGPGDRWWAATVADQLSKAGQGVGVKALLSGEVGTPPAVDVSPLPEVPARLLDLVPREGLEEQTFSYLRQTVATNNAAPVADGAIKPTSVYTFEEVEDRARVIAHLSEPFPVRYAADHTSMMQVLQGQMQSGIFTVIEDQLVNGSGVGEEWPGILNTSGVAQVAYDTDKVTTLRKARTGQEMVGERVTAVAMHPSDIEALDLLREDGSTGGFLLDNDAYERIFGPGVRGVPSVAVPVGQAIVGDWSQTRLLVREAAHTLAATQAGDLFDKNQMKLRAEGRFGFEFFRPQAMAVVALTAPAA